MANKPHTLAVRAERWESIEKKAWKMSNAAGKIIKPTDIADALLWKNLETLTIEDIENAKKAR